VVSQHWLGIIVGFLAGAVVGILTANLIVWLLNRLWPRSPNLLCYALREDPGLLPGLSGLLDSSAGTESREVGLESRSNSLRDQSSLDDSLLGAAISAAQQCKNLLEGKKSQRVDADLEKLQWGEPRGARRAIARDPRLAAK
jgi:hypothetical protein